MQRFQRCFRGVLLVGPVANAKNALLPFMTDRHTILMEATFNKSLDGWLRGWFGEVMKKNGGSKIAATETRPTAVDAPGTPHKPPFSHRGLAGLATCRENSGGGDDAGRLNALKGKSSGAEGAASDARAV